MPNTSIRLAAALVAAATVAAATVAAARPAAAQEDLPARGAPLAQRVTGARDGTVRLTFAVRPGICGEGTSIRMHGDRSRTWSDDRNRSRDVEWEDDCETGPGRLALDVRGGEVRALRFYVGGRWKTPTSDVTDLGAAPAAQVAGMLLGLAERGVGRVSRDAIFPSTLVDSVTVWPTLLKIARDDRLDRETRGQAVFWLGEAAGDKATEGLTALTDDPDREVREQAVFALSRRPREEGVPALIRIARTHHDPATRRSALFWLGRSDDPRALALFEELLTKK
jgi:HEAT repeats